MNFTEIDMSVWNRTELFRYDIDRLRIVMSLTVDIDMTPLLELIDRKNLKFSPTMMWVVSKTVNLQEEFRYDWGMPLTMNILHVTVDGFHLSQFFEKVQQLINQMNGEML